MFYFDCESPTKRKIAINMEWDQPADVSKSNTISFKKVESLYFVDMDRPNLHELFRLQSFYYGCAEAYQQLELIQLQQDVSIFFQSYLELGGMNFMQFLVVEPHCLKAILSADVTQFQRKGHPLIYKSHIKVADRYFTVSPIDMALKM